METGNRCIRFPLGLNMQGLETILLLLSAGKGCLLLQFFGDLAMKPVISTE